MGLLSFLFGNPNGTNAQGQNPNPSGSMLPGGPPPPHTWGTDPQGYLTPVPNGAGNIPPPNDSAATPPAHGDLVKALAAAAPAAPGNQPPQSSNAPVTVTGKRPIWANNAPDLGDASRGDTWQPHHESILGNLSDAILGTTIGERDMRQNKMEALQTLDSNPELAIARMAKVDPESAMKLYSEYNAMKHWNNTADRQGAMTDLQSTQKFGQMMSGIVNKITHDANGKEITPDPAAWSAAMNYGKTLAQRLHVPDDAIGAMLPDAYDPTSAGAIIGMGDPTYRQVNAAEKASEFTQMQPYRQMSAEGSLMRGQAAMMGANNGTARQQTYQQATDQQGAKIQHDITIHPGPQEPVAAMGNNTHQSAGVLIPSNKNPNILYRQHGNYMVEYAKTNGGATPTGRAIVLDPQTGKPTGLADTHVLATEHPELFSR